MKKQYIKPSIITEEIEEQDFIAASSYGCGCTTRHNGSWSVHQGICNVCGHPTNCKCHNKGHLMLIEEPLEIDPFTINFED